MLRRTEKFAFKVAVDLLKPEIMQANWPEARDQHDDVALAVPENVIRRFLDACGAVGHLPSCARSSKEHAACTCGRKRMNMRVVSRLGGLARVRKLTKKAHRSLVVKLAKKRWSSG
jgi:hypothetical protein